MNEPIACPECGKTFASHSGVTGHRTLAHGYRNATGKHAERIAAARELAALLRAARAFWTQGGGETVKW